MVVKPLIYIDIRPGEDGVRGLRSPSPRIAVSNRIHCSLVAVVIHRNRLKQAEKKWKKRERSLVTKNSCVQKTRGLGKVNATSFRDTGCRYKKIIWPGWYVGFVWWKPFRRAPWKLFGFPRKLLAFHPLARWMFYSPGSKSWTEVWIRWCNWDYFDHNGFPSQQSRGFGIVGWVMWLPRGVVVNCNLYFKMWVTPRRSCFYRERNGKERGESYEGISLNGICLATYWPILLAVTSNLPSHINIKILGLTVISNWLIGIVGMLF